MYSQVTSIFIVISNILLSMYFKMITIYEKYSSKTSFNIVMGKALSVALFVNTSLLPILLNVVVYDTYYYNRIYGLGGLA